MCAEQPHGTAQEALENLRQSVPPKRKLQLILRNYWIKVRTRSSCCGNYGEPGC